MNTTDFSINVDSGALIRQPYVEVNLKTADNRTSLGCWKMSPEKAREFAGILLREADKADGKFSVSE